MPCAIRELNINPLEQELASLLEPLQAGRSLGLLSEAGCPAIADPGAALVEAAHLAGFRVVPLIGPSSITLALMASGLEGQRFAFCGYLPREKSDRDSRIRALEKRSRSERETEIFIETPYRNDALLLRVVDDVLGLDHLAGDRVEAAEAVGQAELDAPFPAPDQAAEHVGGFLQPLPPPLAHHADELPVDLLHQLLGVLPVLLVEG